MPTLAAEERLRNIKIIPQVIEIRLFQLSVVNARNITLLIMGTAIQNGKYTMITQPIIKPIVIIWEGQIWQDDLQGKPNTRRSCKRDG